MIPEFPQFKGLELSDKEAVETITKKYPPYSDFNFVSMWSWDIKGDMRISLLNGNLVVKFTDYLSGEPFYSFLGDNQVNETAEELLELSKKEGLEPKLKLVPEISLKDLDNKKYSVVEHRNNFDYVYSTEKLVCFPGAVYRECRNKLNRFTKRNKNIRIDDLDLKSVENRIQVLKLNDLWKANKEFNFDNENEDKALMRVLNTAEYLPLSNVGIFVGNELVAFTINDKLSNKYCLSHFAKFDVRYKGAYIYSMRITTQKLKAENYEYINCEQDLGLPGLRQSKQRLQPAFYLKKYTLRKHASTANALF